MIYAFKSCDRYVEVLDKYFGSVCELDIIFNFEKAYFILDELILGGEMQVILQEYCRNIRSKNLVNCSSLFVIMLHIMSLKTSAGNFQEGCPLSD